jgi:cob(I)alamin adenosyltransferase
VGNRLSKIYTRTGDDGSTGLGNGERVSKDHVRVEAYGTVDELNSLIGVVAASNIPPEYVAVLSTIQQQLFDLGGELSLPDSVMLGPEMVSALEQAMDKLNEALPPLKEFVLPGGTLAAANCHLARAVCRRAERRLFSLATTASINEHSIHYLNRLSDLLFVLARTLNRLEGENEVLWNSQRNAD